MSSGCTLSEARPGLRGRFPAPTKGTTLCEGAPSRGSQEPPEQQRKVVNDFLDCSKESEEQEKTELKYVCVISGRNSFESHLNLCGSHGNLLNIADYLKLAMCLNR